MIINKTYFETGELRLGQIGSVEVQEKINTAINAKEPKYLELMLGRTVYLELKAAIDALPAGNPYKDLSLLPQPWFSLVNGADYLSSYGIGSANTIHWVGLASPDDKSNSPIAKYVFFYYTRSESTFLTGSGATVPKLENGTRVSVAGIQKWQWNTMVGLNKELFAYMHAHKNDFPEWPYDHVYPYLVARYDRWNCIPHRIHSSVLKDMFTPINELNI